MDERDTHFMEEALAEARVAFAEGNVPIGAVLTIDGTLAGRSHNRLYTNQNWMSHAETSLIFEHAAAVRTAHKSGKRVELYTTLDPCLMCFGVAGMNRVKRIVYGCPDPDAGMANTPPITEYYRRFWPQVSGPLLPEESHRLLIAFMRERPDWASGLESFLRLPYNK